ncbi:MAG: DUF11 domain-containing protein [Gemmataceae bacterium]|nr:DUF11 domain-containing protein [Gemmataceae bacterium]
MKSLLALTAACIFWTLDATAQAQFPQAAPLPPLLYVKLLGPKGMQVSVQSGNAPAQTFNAPCTFGLRPGYSYRLAVSGVPGFAGQVFYPTLEAHGSLFTSPTMRAADFPAALVFSVEDFAKVNADITLKRVLVLERPDVALPEASKPDAPPEINVPASRDIFNESRERGLALLVMRLGGRTFTPEEIAENNVPGTILLPNEKTLVAPAAPPWIQWACYPLLDPVLGPVPFSEYVTLFDGGDVGLSAGFNREGRLKGLDPSDTVAEYIDSQGVKRLACSNRIGLCIPRFVVYASEYGISNQTMRWATLATRSTKAHASYSADRGFIEHSQRLQLEGTSSRQKASASMHTVGLVVTGRVDGVDVKGTARGTGVIDGLKVPPLMEPDDGPLCIIKWPDKMAALVGDILTFTLKYTNTGGRPITNVVVSDSLTSRFQYVPGSAKTDRETIFTTEPNDAGSHILRWEITGTLQPRESGIITFQVRVR